MRSRGVVRYRVVSLLRKALYNRRMKMPLLAVTLAAMLAAGCGATDPEAELRASLAAAEAAAEQRDAGFFADLVAESGATLLAGVDADIYRFELELVNDGEWRIIGARWNRALGE